MTTRSSTFGSVRGGCTVRVSRAGLSGHAREMAPAVLPCISAASVLYDTGFSRAVIVRRLQDAVIMQAMGERRACTEEEAIAAYEAIALARSRVGEPF